MRNKEQVTAKAFMLKDKSLAIQHKEETGGLLFRIQHPVFGGLYEVRYIPEPEPINELTWRNQHNLDKALKNWPIYIHYYTGLSKFKK